MNEPDSAVSSKKRKAIHWPRSVRCGSVEVKVYRVRAPGNSLYFQVADYTQGKRRLRSFSDPTKALNEAVV